VSLDTASLPDDVSLLKAMLVVADAELEQLRMQVAKLRRMQFGTSSERLTREADQLDWVLKTPRSKLSPRHCQQSSAQEMRPSCIVSRCLIICRARISCTRPPAFAPTAAAQCGALARM